ncbi:MAG: DUF1573 domain-containing protein [Planctomycetaceae bacterium]
MRFATIFGGIASLLVAGWLVIWLSTQQVAPVVKETPEPTTPLDPAKDVMKENPFEEPKGPKLPKLEVSEREFNFGILGFQPNKDDYVGTQHDFVIKNVGDAPLKLAKGPSTCQCTLSTLTDLEVAPGESTVVSLEWFPTAVTEEFSKQATIWTNDPTLWKEAEKNHAQPGQLLLDVKGKVVNSVVAEPTSFSIGTLIEGEPTVLTGYVSSQTRDDLEVSVKGTSSEHVTAEVFPLTDEELANGKNILSGVRLVCTIQPRMSMGRVRESVTLTTNDAVVPEVVVSIEAQRQGPISIAGRSWNSAYSYLDFGTFRASQGAQTILSLYIAKGSAPIELKLVDHSPSELQISFERDDDFEEEEREHHRLKIVVPPDAPPSRLMGKDAGEVVIQTNLEELPELKFRVAYESR